MAKIIDDTITYKQIIGDLNSCIQNCTQEVDSFFTEIQNIKSWEGKAKDDYLNKTLVEKSKCLDFCESLNKFVVNLDVVGNNIDEAINALER